MPVALDDRQQAIQHPDASASSGTVDQLRLGEACGGPGAHGERQCLVYPCELAVGHGERDAPEDTTTVPRQCRLCSTTFWPVTYTSPVISAPGSPRMMIGWPRYAFCVLWEPAANTIRQVLA